MNRYEALNALGLEEGADEQDVRLAYYGLQKAAQTQDFSDKEKLADRVDAQLMRAKECRDFLLANGTTNAGKVGRSGGAMKGIFGRKKAEKMEITSERDKQARLAGLERLRINLLTYRDHEAQHRLTCFVTIILAIVFGFIALRYVRVVAPRAIMMVAVAVAAIASSTGFTSAHLQCRAAKRHLLDIDDRIHELRVELGIEDEGEEGEGKGGINASELPSSHGKNLVERADDVLAAASDAAAAGELEEDGQALLEPAEDDDEDERDARR